MGNKTYTVAIVGATGMVGEVMISVLEERRFPVRSLVPLASEGSAGKKITFRGERIPVQTLTENSFRGVDIALFSAGGDVSKRFSPVAAKEGTIVIDNSSAFRMDPQVPLIVPEVNPDAIVDVRNKNIIANPNCSVSQIVIVLEPLRRAAGIRRMVTSTYQSISGAGREASNELLSQVEAFASGTKPKVKVLPHQIAFNCIPQIDVFLDDGSTKEEQKVVDETKKILGDPTIEVAAMAVRVPVLVGHAASIFLELLHPLTPEDAREVLRNFPGVTVLDDPKKALYPLPLEAEGKDDVFVGRIRRDPTVPNGLSLWVVADNLRKGAALNAVQIAELLVERNLV